MRVRWTVGSFKDSRRDLTESMSTYVNKIYPITFWPLILKYFLYFLLPWPQVVPLYHVVYWMSWSLIYIQFLFLTPFVFLNFSVNRYGNILNLSSVNYTLYWLICTVFEYLFIFLFFWFYRLVGLCIVANRWSMFMNWFVCVVLITLVYWISQTCSRLLKLIES